MKIDEYGILLFLPEEDIYVKSMEYGIGYLSRCIGQQTNIDAEPVLEIGFHGEWAGEISYKDGEFFLWMWGKDGPTRLGKDPRTALTETFRIIECI